MAHPIKSIHNRFDHPIKFYDNGSGDLFILRDSTSTLGVVRADTWEEAYECAEDELFPEADEATWEDMAKECDYTGPLDNLSDDAIFQENYGFRPNGRNSTDKHGHGIYQKDLNGERLDSLTDAMIEELELTIAWGPRDPSQDDYVCTDCAMMIANGEGSPDSTEEEDAKRAEDCAGWCLTGTEESGEPGFSWRPCACCRSSLGGDRCYAIYTAPVV